ncbi:hypothetical protein ARSEF1564_009350 [Beauveria bassiana]
MEPLSKKGQVQYLSSEADEHDDEEEPFQETTANSLNELLKKVRIPQLSGHEQIQLMDMIECAAFVEKHRRSMDENGARFMLFFRQHALRKGRTSEIQLSWREIDWAYHSTTQDILVGFVARQTHGPMLWKHARESGLFMWITDVSTLRAQFENVAKNEYTNSETKSPVDCSLFYLALKKKTVLQALWRMAVGNKEQAATQRLLLNNFEEDSLLPFLALFRANIVEYAAAFFLLAGRLGDAVEVCLRQLKDIQLAIAITRVYEGDSGPILRKLLQDEVLPLAAQEGDRWLASWAFWMLGRKDMAVRALITPVYTLLETPTSPDFRSRLFLTDDPALVVLYGQLRHKSLQTLRGASKVNPRVEWEFVLHSAKIYDRMGCDLLGLDLGLPDPNKGGAKKEAPAPTTFEEPDAGSLLDSFGFLETTQYKMLLARAFVTSLVELQRLLQHQHALERAYVIVKKAKTMAPSIPGQNFTIRAVTAGLAIGTVICAANVYFGLQTGWVSIMSMPASLMGFGIFRLLRSHIELPFSPVENVFVQSVACGMAIMPLGCGFVGVIPAIDYLLSPEERGSLNLSTWQLVIWSLGLCYFGVVFAVLLRKQVIIRERLRFPSGFSTAVLISVLHGQSTQSKQALDKASKGGFASLVPQDNENDEQAEEVSVAARGGEPAIAQSGTDWAANLRLLLLCFTISGFATLLTYFFPVLRNIPVFGTAAAQTWLWTLNPSLAYVGQGIIMGTETTMHMALGAFVGWAILSPLAKYRGWAPGPVDDWDKGSKGWIVWISLAIMLVDAVVSLGYLATRSLFLRDSNLSIPSLLYAVRRKSFGKLLPGSRARYALLQRQDDDSTEDEDDVPAYCAEQKDEDAPQDQRISNRAVVIVIAVFMALVLSIMGVRALGETDLNPVSGISKLAQLFFAFIIPQSNKSSVLINLVAGAVSEAGALQAGDLMQDLKTGHLLGASPKAQFWGQMIGATAGAVLSAFIYRLYTRIYEIPGDLFQVPTAYVWIFTARLVTGQGLPYMAKEWAIAAGALFACVTVLRTVAVGKSWRSWIPGGIAVAVGMYNVPSFTLARAAGGILAWVWLHVMRRSSTPLIILASGFILGEGFLSIANLVMEGLSVPHY